MNKDELETKLIIEVKNHRCIYDKRNATYKDRYVKADSWSKIASIVGKPVLECQKKWTNLRDTFFRLFKNEQRIPSGSGACSSIKWKHYSNLLYLSEFAQIPSTMTNYEKNIEYQECQNILVDVNESVELFKVKIEIDENYVEDDLISLEAQMPKPPPVKPSKPKKSRRSSEIGEKIFKAISNLNVPEPISIPPPTALEQFFNSLARQAEGLDDSQKLQLQIKCLQALEDVRSIK